MRGVIAWLMAVDSLSPVITIIDFCMIFGDTCKDDRKPERHLTTQPGITINGENPYTADESFRYKTASFHGYPKGEMNAFVLFVQNGKLRGSFFFPGNEDRIVKVDAGVYDLYFYPGYEFDQTRPFAGKERYGRWNQKGRTYWIPNVRITKEGLSMKSKYYEGLRKVEIHDSELFLFIHEYLWEGADKGIQPLPVRQS